MNRKNEAIKLKLEKANMLLQEVPVLIQFKYHSTAINRMYYSCFNATKALLLTKDAIPKTHSGVIKMLHELFVKTGEFDKSSAVFLVNYCSKELNLTTAINFLLKEMISANIMNKQKSM